MSLANLALSGARAASSSGGQKQLADVIEFIEEPWGLSMKLFPVQKVILKAHYGIELDDTKLFTISDWRRQKFTQFTEKGYLKYLFEEGRSSISEVVPGEDRREMILSIGRRSGKCVVGSTLVLTSRGVFPIESLGLKDGPEVQPLVLDVAQEGFHKSTSAYFYNGGVRETHKITSYTGLSVEGTGNHRVRVLTQEGVVEWKNLSDIQTGDVLAVHRNTDFWVQSQVSVTDYHVKRIRRSSSAQPNLFDGRWGLLMGYLVGDGGWTNKSSLSITVEHPETRLEVESLLEALCGRKSSFSHDKRTDRTGSVQIHDRSLRKFLHNLGFNWGCKPTTKKTPWVILRSPKAVVRAYLQGLFETDGSVSKDGRVVSYSTASQELAHETQVLLLNFGVVSRVRVKFNRKMGRNYYELIVLGLRSRQTFSKEIGFRSIKKQGPLDSGLVSPSREGGATESIPHQRVWISKLLTSIPKKSKGCGLSRTALRSVLGNTCKPSSKDDLTYSRVQALIPIAESLGADPVLIQHFKDLLDVDYFFDSVTTTGLGSDHVYDLNVPVGESFVANGLTNHNTTISAAIASYETYKLISKGNPQEYYGLPAANPIQLISVATDKDQAGLLYQEVSGHYRNCFAAETEIITGDGIKPIGMLAGTTQTLLTRDGSWVDAPIRSFGTQQLHKLTLTRQGIEKVVYVTGNHRWFARDARKAFRGNGFQEFTTTELRPGKHHLQVTFGRSYKNKITPSPFGVAHGFTYGDGTAPGGRSAGHVYLFGKKDEALLPFFSMCPQKVRNVEAGGVECIELGALPNFFKDLPSIRENKAYLLGWLMGYFAADGCSSRSGVEVVSVNRESLEFYRDVCAIMGIGTYGIREENRISNLTEKPSRIFKLKLMRGTLDESFFLLEHHRKAFVALGGDDVRRKVLCWTVKSVELTDRVEEVFCATVADHGDFVLEGNLATGNCAFFAPYTANNTMSYARFQTPKDIERYGSFADNQSAKATIKVTFRSCIAKGLRGAGNIVVILDEVAHFTDAGQSSADAVYNAVVPSTSAYSPKDPSDNRVPTGPVEARVILISSPLGRQGLFYKLFQMGMGGGTVSKNMLCIQAPTWEVNPTIPASEFEKHYLKDPAVFFTEYGGEFTDRTRGWIEREEDLTACIHKDLRPVSRGISRKPHFLGLDLGLVGDGTAIAIGHITETGKIRADLIDQIKAGEGKYADKTRLDFDDVADWVEEYSKKFYLAEGIFDQWSGIPFEQALKKRGLTQMNSEHITKPLASQMYQNFKDMLWDQGLELYDFPIPQHENHCDYIKEILELQARYHSKYITTVEAPNIEGKHDDRSDALIRMVWLASNRLKKQPHLSKSGLPLGGSGHFGTSPVVSSRLRLLRSGSHESRMIPRGPNGSMGGPRRR